MLHDEYPVKPFKNALAFEKWLAKNHKKENGIWIKIAKANTGIATVSYMEAIDVALCYGWIDGLRRSADENYYVQKFTPRRSNSQWSAINKNKVARLIKEGKMQAAGLEAIEAAKKNGQWTSS
jgi:uncharacterized protein YdeI (YjbR/CyaY-like superfamily)